jgi:hypothetical protein
MNVFMFQTPDPIANNLPGLILLILVVAVPLAFSVVSPRVDKDERNLFDLTGML